MAIISNKNKELYDLGKGDNLIEFDLVNSTASDITYDLFNTTTLSLVPTSAISGVQLPPSYISFVNSIGGDIEGIGYNPLSNTVYCIDSSGYIIIVFNSTLTSTITTITTYVGAALRNIIYNNINNSMYVTDANGNVLRVDCNTNTVIDTIALVGANPVNLCFDSLNNRVYVGNTATNDVFVINCNTNTVIATVVTPSNPFDLAYNSLSNTVYVTSTSNDISIIDCNTNTVINTIPFANPIGNITYDSLNNRMYIGQGTINAVLVLDCFTDTVISTIPATASVRQLLYVSAFNLVYVNLLTGGTIVIDCSTNTIVNTIAGGSAPSGIVYNTIDNYIYVAVTFTNTISLISSLSPPPVPYSIGGSFNYNQFIQDVINNPICVDRLIIVSQQNTTNFNQVLNVVYKDANGIETQNPFIPSLSVGTSQFQSGIGKVDFLDQCFVLGVNQYLYNFLVKANSSVKILLVYKQLEKSKLLTDKKGMCGRLEFKGNPLQTYNPTNNDAPFDDFNIIPIKPTKPTIRPFSVRDIVPNKPDIRTDIKVDDVKTDTKTSIKPLRVSNIYGGQKDITCGACEWSWNRNESEADDVYVCHKCGYDNQKIYQNEKLRVSL
jgi:YVTN family beta-propeller protein